MLAKRFKETKEGEAWSLKKIVGNEGEVVARIGRVPANARSTRRMPRLHATPAK